jgi:hypothetical protein
MDIMKNLAALVLCSLVLAGCGGGGGDSGGGGGGPVNTAPVANAGAAQTVVTGGVVTLDGSASSDADGNNLTYAWTLARPAGSSATLSSTTAAKPTFTADVAGTYTASLVVNDGTASSTAATATVTAGGVLISSLAGNWTGGTTNYAPAVSASVDITISVAANTLTIVSDQFVGTEGVCTYSAPLNGAGDGVGSGTYACNGSVTGTWQLVDLRRVDTNDRYVKLTRNGTDTKVLYGMATTGSAGAQTPPAALSSRVGTYEGVTSVAGETIHTEQMQVAVAGSALTVTIPRDGFPTCVYSGTIGADGISVTGGTYACTGDSGSWSLLDLRTIGGDDVYVSMLVNGEARRAFGIAK